MTLPQAAAAAAALPLQQNASVELPPTLAPPLAVRRSTRPKLAVRRDNVSAALVPVLKRLNELLRHHYAAPFATPVDFRLPRDAHQGAGDQLDDVCR